MNKTVVARLVGVIVGLTLVAAVGVYAYKEAPKATKFIDMVTQKINSIITPGAPIGNLTPTRDLRGRWTSSLQGKGLQLYGSFSIEGGTVEVYEDGDIELVIESVDGNTATGEIRWINLYGSGSTTIPEVGTVSMPRTLLVQDSGYCPITIRVSGSRLDFGSFSTGGVSGSMQGSYTTDLMSGTMTAQTEYGPIKGEFHLMRQE
ncbi:MAG: hypothetical protein U1F44_08660 [Coriobacteriia bacterium]|nr:hypothetical protein [Coriobacteriia bacterium]